MEICASDVSITATLSPKVDDLEFVEFVFRPANNDSTVANGWKLIDEGLYSNEGDTWVLEGWQLGSLENIIYEVTVIGVDVNGNEDQDLEILLLDLRDR